jgi:hypothetical protein
MTTEQTDTTPPVHKSNVDPMPEHFKSPLDQSIAARNKAKRSASQPTPRDPLAVDALRVVTPSLAPAVIEAIEGTARIRAGTSKPLTRRLPQLGKPSSRLSRRGRR